MEHVPAAIALKGRNIPAHGNAVGELAINICRPEGATYIIISVQLYPKIFSSKSILCFRKIFFGTNFLIIIILFIIINFDNDCGVIYYYFFPKIILIFKLFFPEIIFPRNFIFPKNYF